jgi:hypothetical protein
METIEKKVADAILEKATDKITIEGNDYPIAPPTTGTLILISELVATMPIVNKNANALYEVLRTAKDLSVIGKIAATLILGAKRIKEQRKVCKTENVQHKHWSWRKLHKVTDTTTKSVKVLEVDYLAEKLIDEVETHTLNNVIVKRLGESQFGDFFVLTTSLSEVNLLKRTKEVETASGD